MKAGIPKEVTPGETRVAMIPETVKKLTSMKLDVLVEASAGAASGYPDADYQQAGATIVASADELYSQADMILKVAKPTDEEVGKLKEGQVVVAMLAPAFNTDLAKALADKKVISFSLDAVPRITRAQSMDVLSSMSTIAGYKAVLLAADSMPKMCPMLTTAAGTIRPAQALIIGAGVAGLQAIATAKRIGCVTTAIDVRPAVKEQVESLGAKFIAMEVDHAAEDAGGYATDLGEDFYKGEQEIIAPHSKGADMIITTALIPGRDAPVLITQEMVEAMKPGSVIVDLAAIAGGNCTLSKPDETVVHQDVTILGPTNLPAQLPLHASQMFSRNVATFLGEFITKEGQLNLDMENEVVAGSIITHEGEIKHELTLKAINGSN
ncbi:MAG: Re/Si-specific NAD(P)(+) transhydrogenase subunit alpha [Phycisphaerae bacterium]